MISVRVNGRSQDTISVADRGLNYGDGVFETILLKEGKLHFWPEHFQRLKNGCAVLGIHHPDEGWFLDEIRLLSLQQQNGVIKIVVTRGIGGRGYLADADHKASCILSLHELPGDLKQKQQGIKCGVSQHKLIIHPALAGIKHLNRLDQVIARNEWQNTNMDEVLMPDNQGNLVEGSSSNLFYVKDKLLITAPESECAVAGVVRRAVIKWAMTFSVNTIEEKLSASDLQTIDEVFVCNSIWGIVPVLQIMNHDKAMIYSSESGVITGQMQKKYLESYREHDATVI